MPSYNRDLLLKKFEDLPGFWNVANNGIILIGKYDSGQHLSDALVDKSIIDLLSKHCLFVLEFNPESGNRSNSSPDFNFDEIMESLNVQYISFNHFGDSQHISSALRHVNP
jgi:hypothetical protein